MKTLAETLEFLNHNAETICNTDPQSVATMEVGDEWRQGDFRIIRFPDDFTSRQKKQLREVKNPSSQIAPGNTPGSRHVLARMEGVRFYEMVDATPLDGPVIKTTVENSITHPEHGHVINLPKGCYTFPGQRAFAETLRRTED